MSPRINSPERDTFVSVGRVELPIPVVVFAGEEMDESSNLWNILKEHFQSLLVKIRIYFDRQHFRWSAKRGTAALFALLLLDLTFFSSLLILTNRASFVMDHQTTLDQGRTEVCEKQKSIGSSSECLDFIEDQIALLTGPAIGDSLEPKMKRVEQIMKEQIEHLSVPATIDSGKLKTNMKLVEKAQRWGGPFGYLFMPYNSRIESLFYLMNWLEDRNDLFCGPIRSTSLRMKSTLFGIIQEVDEGMNEMFVLLREIQEEQNIALNKTKEWKMDDQIESSSKAPWRSRFKLVGLFLSQRVIVRRSVLTNSMSSVDIQYNAGTKGGPKQVIDSLSHVRWFSNLLQG
eukprot:scaffold24022_cov168-Amphora_coffeaeformis.AAC.5